MSVEEAKRRAIFDKEDPDKIDTTNYDYEDWGAYEDCSKPSTDVGLKAVVHIDGETQLRIFAMKSVDKNYFPLRKNGRICLFGQMFGNE